MKRYWTEQMMLEKLRENLIRILMEKENMDMEDIITIQDIGQEVVKDFQDYYQLKDGSKILDVGCGKGFMVYDFLKLNPKFEIKGIDISNYAINNCKSEVANNLQVASCDNLPFEDNSFDLVISINTIHNLEKDECGKSLREINRVSRKNKFIIVDAYRDNEEKKKMFAWNLTAKTIMHVNEWLKFLKKINMMEIITGLTHEIKKKQLH